MIMVYIVRDTKLFQILGVYSCASDASKRMKQCPNSIIESCPLNHDRELQSEPECQG